MSQHPSNPPPQHLSLRWWIAASVMIIAFGFGGWGMWWYEREHQHEVDPLSVAYHTLQMFALHAPHLEHPAPWQLHMGRWLAVGVVFWATLRGLAAVFWTDWQLYWTKLCGGHVIICGLGRLGRQLATEFRAAGDRVIAIDAKPDLAAVLTKSGLSVLTGDACAADELRRAGVSNARQLIAVCDDVQTNVAIIAEAGRLVTAEQHPQQREEMLESWLFVPDAQLRQLFKHDGLFPHKSNRFRVNVRGLDVFSLAARQALTENPLDYRPIRPGSNTLVHLVIVGFGSMGQRLALQAAQIGHFANFRHPKITVLEQAGSPRVDAFLSRYKRFNELIDVERIEFSPDDSAAAKKLSQAAQPADDVLTTVALCWDSQRDTSLSEDEMFHRLEQDDAVNLRLALDLHAKIINEEQRTSTLLFQTKQCGFAYLFRDSDQSSPLSRSVHVFGTLEETCSREALLHESTDKVAQVLHEDYYQRELDAHAKRGDSTTKPAVTAWEELGEVYKESNRHAADHIRVKLRAIGYDIAERQGDAKRLMSLDAPEQERYVELLAKMEHDRWCAEKMLMNYSHPDGPVIVPGKTHRCLVPWEDQRLTTDDKDRDRNQIRAIPQALAEAGLGIYPYDRTEPGVTSGS